MNAHLHRHLFGPHVIGPDGFSFAPHVGEFFTRMRIDGSMAKDDAVRAAAGAGDAAGATFGQRFKSQFTKANLGKGIAQGLGFGVGLGVVGVVARGISTVTDAIHGSIDAAIGWESAMAGVNKTLDTTGLSSEEAAAALQEIEDGLRDMALRIPVPVEQLAALAEAGGALGIAREDLLSFVETSALLGTTTNIAAQDAATALGKINAVMPLTREEYSRFAATLVDLGNKGASTEAEIVSMAQNMAGAGALIGQSHEQLLGWAAALANAGEEAEAGGSSFQRFALGINQMVASASPRLEELADLAGVTGDEFANLWDQDANEALRRVVNGLAGLDKNARQATLAALGFTDIRITRALLALTANTDNLNDSLAVSEEAWQANTAATVEANKRFATTESKLQLVQNRLHDIGIVVGEQLINAAEQVVGIVGGIAEAIDTALHPERDQLLLLDEQIRRTARSMGLLGDEVVAYAQAQRAAAAAQREANLDADSLTRLLQQTLETTEGFDDAAKNSLISDFVERVRALGVAAEDIPYAFQLAREMTDEWGETVKQTDDFMAVLANRLGLVSEAAAGTTVPMDEARKAVDAYLLHLQQLAPSADMLADLGRRGGAALAGGIQEGIDQAPSLDLAGKLAEAREDAAQRTAWREAGIGFAFDLTGGFRQGVEDSKAELAGASLELRAAAMFDWGAEAAFAIGNKFARRLRMGFRSGEPEVVEDAQGLALAGLEAIDKSGREGPKAADRIGMLLTKLYASGMTRQEVSARLAGEGVNLVALEAIARKQGWFSGGENLVETWAAGIKNALALAKLSIVPLVGDIADLFIGQSPPPKGPLSRIDVGGYNVGRAWAENFIRGIAVTPAALAGALPMLSGIGMDPLGITASVIGGIGPIGVSVGDQTVRVVHEFAPGTAQEMRAAGYSPQDIGTMLAAAVESAHIGRLRPAGI